MYIAYGSTSYLILKGLLKKKIIFGKTVVVILNTYIIAIIYIHTTLLPHPNFSCFGYKSICYLFLYQGV